MSSSKSLSKCINRFLETKEAIKDEKEEEEKQEIESNKNQLYAQVGFIGLFYDCYLGY